MKEFLDKEIKKQTKILFSLYGAIDDMKSMKVVNPLYCCYSSSCQLYEYFLSGKAETLDGAYHLYEEENKKETLTDEMYEFGMEFNEIKIKVNEEDDQQSTLYKIVKEVKDEIELIKKALTDLQRELLTSSKIKSIESLQRYSAYSSFVDSHNQYINRLIKEIKA